jgi:hypothetical protein
VAKEAYYFSHDSNARHDPKCSALINDFGAEGYGIFWMIIEILSEQEGYKLRKFSKLYEGLSRQIWVDAEKIRSIIEAMLHEYELLVQDDSFIWSESLLKRMMIKEEKRNKKVEAGRKGGIKSGFSRKKEATTKQNEAVLEANEAKEIKVKEIKVKEIKEKDLKDIKRVYSENVQLTEIEYQKLVSEHGQDFADECVSTLCNYKGASGKKYKSDYKAILTWVIDKVKERRRPVLVHRIQQSRSQTTMNKLAEMYKQAEEEERRAQNGGY